MSSRPIKIDLIINKEQKINKEFGNQYSYYNEEKDDKHPETRIEGLEFMGFSDSDHGHDYVTGWSITGVIDFMGSMSIVWTSKRHTSVHTSTYGEEFTSLNKEV